MEGAPKKEGDGPGTLRFDDKEYEAVRAFLLDARIDTAGGGAFRAQLELLLKRLDDDHLDGVATLKIATADGEEKTIKGPCNSRRDDKFTMQKKLSAMLPGASIIDCTITKKEAAACKGDSIERQAASVTTGGEA